ncbi:protein of unknown function (DUF4802) [Popillia japonica]|uniref:DUF4802 domain-containing protein n=1 Tax=Popillia japonica TaxID=7064 RepID=A0AAW1IYH8_POPJA
MYQLILPLTQLIRLVQPLAKKKPKTAHGQNMDRHHSDMERRRRPRKKLERQYRSTGGEKSNIIQNKKKQAKVLQFHFNGLELNTNDKPFFIHNKTKKTVPQENNNKTNPQETNTSKSGKSSTTQTENQNKSSRRSSIDLYEEAASILGLTCAQTDNCKCIECQCHYFDFEEEIDFSTGGEYMVDHTSTCSIQ